MIMCFLTFCFALILNVRIDLYPVYSPAEKTKKQNFFLKIRLLNVVITKSFFYIYTGCSSGAAVLNNSRVLHQFHMFVWES